jgi:hypothetical protein
MSDSSHQLPRPHRRGNTLVAKYSFVWILAAVLLSLSEAVSLGTVTAPVVALDIVAGAHLPFGLVSIVAAHRGPVGADEPPADDDSDGGGGSRPPDPEPTPPSGGIGFDWSEFETAFRAYARESELATIA